VWVRCYKGGKTFGGDCLMVGRDKAADRDWRKSRLCATSECLEVARSETGVRLRNSACPLSEVTATSAEWRAFLLAVKAGEFDDMAASAD
jgi:hypothetical protein